MITIKSSFAASLRPKHNQPTRIRQQRFREENTLKKHLNFTFSEVI